jgi:hypothetical protein
LLVSPTSGQGAPSGQHQSGMTMSPPSDGGKSVSRGFLLRQVATLNEM